MRQRVAPWPEPLKKRGFDGIATETQDRQSVRDAKLLHDRERDAPFLEHRPQRMEIRMRGRLRARHRVHQHRAASGVKRRFSLGAGAVTPRYRADRYQAAVSGAEIRDRAVERTRTAPQKFGVATEKLRKCKGREDELSIHPDQIERAAALGRVERAQREPSFRRHHILFEFDRRARVGGTRLGLRDKLDGFGSRSSQVERPNPLREHRGRRTAGAIRSVP